MAAQEISEFQRAARLKWPQYRIVGDGPFAISCGITSSVHLYAWPMLAMIEIARDHSNWRCKDCHCMVELQPVYPPQAHRRIPACMLE